MICVIFSALVSLPRIWLCGSAPQILPVRCKCIFSFNFSRRNYLTWSPTAGKCAVSGTAKGCPHHDPAPDIPSTVKERLNAPFSAPYHILRKAGQSRAKQERHSNIESQLQPFPYILNVTTRENRPEVHHGYFC